MSNDSLIPHAPETPHQAAHTAAHSVSESGGLPQLNPESYASQVFWLVITFVIFYVLISRSALPRIEKTLGIRKQRIGDDLERAEALTQQADTARASYEKLNADTKKRVGDLLLEARGANETAAKAEHHALDAVLSAKLSEAKIRIEAQSARVSQEVEPLAQKIKMQIVDKILNGHSANQPN